MPNKRTTQRAMKSQHMALYGVRVPHEVGHALIHVSKAQQRSLGFVAAAILESWYQAVYLPHTNKKASG